VPKLIGMAEDDLEEVEENIRILLAEALDVQHRLEGHPTAVAACPVCRAHNASAR
jgi:hypothetical protein